MHDADDPTRASKIAHASHPWGHCFTILRRGHKEHISAVGKCTSTTSLSFVPICFQSLFNFKALTGGCVRSPPIWNECGFKTASTQKLESQCELAGHPWKSFRRFSFLKNVCSMLTVIAKKLCIRLIQNGSF